MKKLIVAVSLSIALAIGAIYAAGTPGFCGWEVQQVSQGCAGGEYLVCRDKFISVMNSDGSWTCFYEVQCESLGACTDVAEEDDPTE